MERTRLEHEWDWEGSEREFRRAIQLDANDANSHHWYGAYLGARGRSQEALIMLKRAEQLDPLSPIIGAAEGFELWLEHHYDEAIAQLRKTL